MHSWEEQVSEVCNTGLQDSPRSNGAVAQQHFQYPHSIYQEWLASSTTMNLSSGSPDVRYTSPPGEHALSNLYPTQSSIPSHNVYLESLDLHVQFQPRMGHPLPTVEIL
jgi:hypothetical protein